MRNLLPVLLAAALLSASALGGEVTVLDEGSPFHVHYTWKTPVVRKGQEILTAGKTTWTTSAPPAGWESVGFDDRAWSLWPGAFLKATGKLPPRGGSPQNQRELFAEKSTKRGKGAL